MSQKRVRVYWPKNLFSKRLEVNLSEHVPAPFSQCALNHFALEGEGLIGCIFQNDQLHLFPSPVQVSPPHVPICSRICQIHNRTAPQLSETVFKGISDSSLKPIFTSIKHPPFCPIEHMGPELLASIPEEHLSRGIDVGVSVILESSDSYVLMTRRAAHMKTFPSVWVPPGGHIETGETMEEGVLRELREETGLDFKMDHFSEESVLGLWESTYPPMLALGDPVRHHIVVYFHFHSTLPHQELQEQLKLDHTEVDAAAWLPLSLVEAIVNVDINGIPESIPVTTVNESGLHIQDEVAAQTWFEERASHPHRLSTGTRHALALYLQNRSISPPTTLTYLNTTLSLALMSFDAQETPMSPPLMPPDEERRMQEVVEEVQLADRDRLESDSPVKEGILHDLAFRGDVHALKSLLESQEVQRLVNLRLRPFIASPLRLAVTANQMGCVKVLLWHGADVDLPDVKFQTPLMVAIHSGFVDIAKVLLDAGADPEGHPCNLTTPLMVAVEAINPCAIRLLMEHGADSESLKHLYRKGYPTWPLHSSIKAGSFEATLMLLCCGALPDLSHLHTERITPELLCQKSLPHCVIDKSLEKDWVWRLRVLREFGVNMGQEDKHGNDVSESLPPSSPHYQPIRDLLCNPLSLQSLCRLRIRRELGRYRIKDIQTLPVTKIMKDFLFYKDCCQV
ncbi:unnamed protein product [Darwinula stevensoni]|uniref:m7GpppN-mRNA hydrolase NUDT17 n=1 Tax=Darwinula stevensoni TaxID=69355 RepID=A0A7R8XK53_9CRUS|nr:unnamed protein product [Darwinula stevensoni]CAG0895975.1 unnamed protein product [Darwinula stevensoni]